MTELHLSRANIKLMHARYFEQCSKTQHRHSLKVPALLFPSHVQLYTVDNVLKRSVLASRRENAHYNDVIVKSAGLQYMHNVVYICAHNLQRLHCARVQSFFTE